MISEAIKLRMLAILCSHFDNACRAPRRAPHGILTGYLVDAQSIGRPNALKFKFYRVISTAESSRVLGHLPALDTMAQILPSS
jgi:hypothetical protein